MKDTVSVQKARSSYYGWLSALFAYVKDEVAVEKIAYTLDVLASQPLEEKSGEALKRMQDFLKTKGAKALLEENNDIFFSIATTLMPVTASYYDEGRDDGKKRLAMTEFFLRSTFRRDTQTSNEPEDHISLIFGLCSSLLEQAANGCEESEKLSNEIFKEIINPFIGTFEQGLFSHESAVFYKDVATVLHAFVSFERFSLHVSEPEYKPLSNEALWQVAKDRKPFVERVRRNLDEIQL